MHRRDDSRHVVEHGDGDGDGGGSKCMTGVASELVSYLATGMSRREGGFTTPRRSC